MIKIAYSSVYNHPLPSGHRFPMEKYDLLPAQLVYENLLTESDFHQPNEIPDEVALWTHELNYYNRLCNNQLSTVEARRTGFPQSPQLVVREKTIAQGGIDIAVHAIKHGTIGLNIAGGTHHAFSNFGAGFCLLNDHAIAAKYLLHQQIAKRILIVDLDVHQGDGTAEIMQNTPEIFTFSMHGAHNFPLKKQTSNLDIPLPDHINDAAYLTLLDQHLNKIIDLVQPEIIFYQAGVDVLADDKLGRLALSLNGCKTRDDRVLSVCHRNNIPLVVSMGGGYSPRIATIIEAHSNTFRLAYQYWG